MCKLESSDTDSEEGKKARPFGRIGLFPAVISHFALIL
jgi:hypothetical protein